MARLIPGIHAFALLLLISVAGSAGEDVVEPYTPKVAQASNEGERAISRFRVPAGFKVELFAAEPHLANPVAFCIDERGRFFVAETFRLHAGVTDIRGHMNWLDDDLACRTVADRVAMLRKYDSKRFSSYETHHDRVRLIEDTDGDGRADRATVFADGFKTAAAGIGAGLLARNGNVWYTCIPNLWLLRDTKGTGQANVRQELQTGYGVRVGFIGHDLHGLRFGPDGKLYFSIGDRGLHVSSHGRTVSSPDTGAVLRCNPDGSDLELFATGLRNPQELVFDQYGNLFTGDNNSDGGDKARWVYVVEGGDSGWRIGYQFIEQPVARGPWNAEKMWHPAVEGQPAFLLPPIANLADGPSGLTYDPGVGLPDRYRNHFFLCDFRGGAGQSGIRSFAVKPKGAAFELVDQHEFLWSVLATDVDFGYDGGLYLTDWVDGWGLTGKGRIYRLFDPVMAKTPEVASAKKLIAEGFNQRSIPELVKLLEHPDARVRQAAQFSLADQGTKAVVALQSTALTSRIQLARLHAIWGLGQLGRRDAKVLAELLPLLHDPDAEVRAQTAKTLGEARTPLAPTALQALLHDPSSRVRFFAAMSLGKLRSKEAIGPLLQMLRENADNDPYLRHAAVMALAGIADLDALRDASRDSSPAVRLGVLLAWRKLENPEIAACLSDAEPRIVLEAARAINDIPIAPAQQRLAALLPRSGLPEPLLRRVLNAHFRLGKSENAAAVAAFAARADAAEILRVEALQMLGDWSKPSGRDRVTGLWRPLETRPETLAVQAFRLVLGGVMSGPEGVRREGARLAARFGIKDMGPVLFDMLKDRHLSASMRLETLRGLDRLEDARVPEAMQLALADADPGLRNEGRRLLAKLRPTEALEKLEDALAKGTLRERQGAFAILAGMSDAKVDQLFLRWLSRLGDGHMPPELQLDLLEAAAKRSSADVRRKLDRLEASRAKGDAVARFRETLVGGDAEQGKHIFFHKTDVYCLRCHKVNGEGGEVAPDLTAIGAKQKREYLLEAILEPNKEIAKGFETTILVLTSGQIQVGILKAEDDREVRLMTAEGKSIVVPKKEIEERGRGKSAMPEDLAKHLSKVELRDLMEYLSSLK